jgi:hypothetical protein
MNIQSRLSPFALVASILAIVACDRVSTSLDPERSVPAPIVTDSVVRTVVPDIDTAIAIHPGVPTRLGFTPHDSALYQISIIGAFATRLEIRDSLGRDTLPVQRSPYDPLTWRAQDNRPVQVFARGSDPLATGTVVFSLKQIDGKDAHEPDNTLATATYLKPDSVAQHHIKATRDVDWVKVPVDSGKVYVVAGAGDRAVMVQLFTADSTKLTAPQMSSASYLPDSDGYLYARITLYDSTATAAYTIVAYNDQKQIDAYEPDDTKDRARPISTDSVPQAHHLRAGETDWMSFHADSGMSYKVHVSGIANGSIVVRCVDGSSAGCLASGSTSAVYKAAATGTAYLYFYAYDKTVSGAYKIAVSVDSAGIDAFEPDDKQSQAKRIEPDGVPQKHYWQTGEWDWVKFHADSGKCYSIKTTGIEDGSIFVKTDSANGNWTIQGVASAQVTAYRTGDIFVMFCRYRSDVSAPYALIVSVDTTGIDKYEPDGNRVLAKSIPTDGTVQSHYLQGTESDFLKCRVDSGVSYRIQVRGNAAIRYDVYVDSADSAASYRGYTTSLFKARKSGTSVIAVSPYLPDDFGAYTISIVVDTFGIDKYEPDDSWSSATSIATDGVPQQHYLQAGESDWLRFEADSGKWYKVVATDKLSDLQYYLCHGDPTRPDWSTSGFDRTGFQAVKSGTHYLRMIAFNPNDQGEYSVSVLADTVGIDAYVPDDGAALAKPIPTAGAYRLSVVAKP